MKEIRDLSHQKQALVESMNPPENLQSLVREFLKSKDKSWTAHDIEDRGLHSGLLPHPSCQIIWINEWEELHELYDIQEIYFLWRVAPRPKSDTAHFIIII